MVSLSWRQWLPWGSFLKRSHPALPFITALVILNISHTNQVFIEKKKIIMIRYFCVTVENRQVELFIAA